uniref:Uncharacterized protein n=1 Tax=Arundo donax TaxID=35708 RepID=A0A0A9HT04_ARUDO
MDYAGTGEHVFAKWGSRYSVIPNILACNAHPPASTYIGITCFHMQNQLDPPTIAIA